MYEPYLTADNLSFAHDAINSSWISSHGKYLNLIKDDLLNLNGSKHVILCNNGTSATHLMAIGLKYKYPNIKNIIVPNNVYVAAWNSFLSNPIFNLIPIDSDINSWNIDLKQLDYKLSLFSNKDTAILIVHNMGNVINVPYLKNKYPNYVFIEDNCEGFLGEYDSFKTGSKSLISSVSFFGNKTLTSGEGGALFTNDDDIFEYLNSVRSQGITDKKFIFDKLGYNYRMTNIQAAILKGQIDDISIIREKKENIFRLYKNNLNNINVIFQSIEANTKHSNWMFGIRVPGININDLMLNLYQQDIETRPMFPPMSHHEHLVSISGYEEISEILYNSCLILPSHPLLQEKQIIYICDKIKKKLNKICI